MPLTPVAVVAGVVRVSAVPGPDPLQGPLLEALHLHLLHDDLLHCCCSIPLGLRRRISCGISAEGEAAAAAAAAAHCRADLPVSAQAAAAEGA